jgi:hypothetical protein
VVNNVPNSSFGFMPFQQKCLANLPPLSQTGPDQQIFDPFDILLTKGSFIPCDAASLAFSCWDAAVYVA